MIFVVFFAKSSYYIFIPCSYNFYQFLCSRISTCHFCLYELW